jgi:hypothetical protein
VSLPDGNKRAAWACLSLFIDLNDGSWNDEHPVTDDAVEAMLAVTAREVDEQWFANWLRARVTVGPSEPEPRVQQTWGRSPGRCTVHMPVGGLGLSRGRDTVVATGLLLPLK